VDATVRTPALTGREHEVVTVLRPEEVEMAAEREQLTTSYMGRATVEELQFTGALERLRLKLLVISSMRSCDSTTGSGAEPAVADANDPDAAVTIQVLRSATEQAQLPVAGGHGGGAGRAARARTADADCRASHVVTPPTPPRPRRLLAQESPLLAARWRAACRRASGCTCGGRAGGARPTRGVVVLPSSVAATARRSCALVAAGCAPAPTRCCMLSPGSDAARNSIRVHVRWLEDAAQRRHCMALTCRACCATCPPRPASSRWQRRLPAERAAEVVPMRTASCWTRAPRLRGAPRTRPAHRGLRRRSARLGAGDRRPAGSDTAGTRAAQHAGGAHRTACTGEGSQALYLAGGRTPAAAAGAGHGRHHDSRSPALGALLARRPGMPVLVVYRESAR
jgi:hypothetical protein